jgi:hypothetical protein
MSATERQTRSTPASAVTHQVVLKGSRSVFSVMLEKHTYPDYPSEPYWVVSTHHEFGRLGINEVHNTTRRFPGVWPASTHMSDLLHLKMTNFEVSADGRISGGYTVVLCIGRFSAYCPSSCTMVRLDSVEPGVDYRIMPDWAGP